MSDTTEDEGGFDDVDMEFVGSTNGQLTAKDAVSSGGSPTVNKPGKYHCVVSGKMKFTKSKPFDNPKADGQTGSAPNVQIVFKVLAGDHPDQVDRDIYCRLYLHEWSESEGKFVMKSGDKLKSAFQICSAIGAAKLNEANQEVSFNFRDIEGQQAIVEVRNDPYDENKGKKGPDGKPLPESMKDSYKIPFGNVWRVDEPSQKDVPRDATMMAIFREGLEGGESSEPAGGKLF